MRNNEDQGSGITYLKPSKKMSANNPICSNRMFQIQSLTQLRVFTDSWPELHTHTHTHKESKESSSDWKQVIPEDKDIKK